MKLLFDENLSRQLVELLATQFPDFDSISLLEEGVSIHEDNHTPELLKGSLKKL